MAIYDQEQGIQSILEAALGEYHSKGFQLTELGNHSLKLYYHDELLGIICQGGVAIPIIHEACRDHLEMLSAS